MDERGYFRTAKHHVVRFRFDDVAGVQIATHSDTLDTLEIAHEYGDDGRFVVTLVSVVGQAEEGFGGSFRARSGVVLEVIPESAK